MDEQSHLIGKCDDDDRVGRRRSARRFVAARIQFGQDGLRARVRLLDLSCHGARLSLVHRLRKDDSFWITLPGLPPITATVSWVDGLVVGCEFTQPLDQEAFDSLMSDNENPAMIDRRNPNLPD